MKKIRFLFTGNFDVEGHPRHYEQGAVEAVPDEDAKRLIAGKCAEAYAKPKIKEGKHGKNNRKMD